MAQHEIDSGGGTSERDIGEGDISDEYPTKKAKLSKSSDTRKMQVLMSLLSNSVINNKACLTLPYLPTCGPSGMVCEQ